jgi:hypothetical protein
MSQYSLNQFCFCLTVCNKAIREPDKHFFEFVVQYSFSLESCLLAEPYKMHKLNQAKLGSQSEGEGRKWYSRQSA